MRNTLLILLSAVYLTGHTELGQLFKLPLLFSHYFQHHRQDPSISFGEFMAMHYGGDDGTTADDERDKQLPWHNSYDQTISHVYSPMVNEILPIKILIPEHPVYNSAIEEGISSKHVQLILQPPKRA